MNGNATPVSNGMSSCQGSGNIGLVGGTTMVRLVTHWILSRPWLLSKVVLALVESPGAVEIHASKVMENAGSKTPGLRSSRRNCTPVMAIVGTSSWICW